MACPARRTCAQIAAALAGKGLDPLLVVAIVMTVIGFGFKVAAVPFHLWAPDAYQGAPTPSAAFIASGSKVASFFIFAKVMMLGFAGAEGSGGVAAILLPGWVPVLAIVAVLSMMLGNLAAIVQSSVQAPARLFGHRACGLHAAGGPVARPNRAWPSLIYYAVTYGLTTIGAFGVVAVVEQATGDDKLSDFAGLEPPRAGGFVLHDDLHAVAGGHSAAGGILRKFYVFTAALKTGAPNLGLLWLVILAIAMSAVSLYYYLQVLKQIYVAEAPSATALVVPALTQVVLCVLALAVLVAGCAPGWIVNPILAAIRAGP